MIAETSNMFSKFLSKIYNYFFPNKKIAIQTYREPAALKPVQDKDGPIFIIGTEVVSPPGSAIIETVTHLNRPITISDEAWNNAVMRGFR